MKRETNRAVREAVGCFLTLVLGAIVCVGLMRIAMLAVSEGARMGQSAWWQTVVLWLLVPGTALAAAVWLTYGFTRPRSR